MGKVVHLTLAQIQQRIKELEENVNKCNTEALKSKRKRIYAQLAKYKKALDSPEYRVDPEEERKVIEKKKAKKHKKISKLIQKVKAKKREEEAKEQQDTKHIMCLACKKWGHLASNCPDESMKKICYNCGSHDHTLAECTTPQTGELKFAKCYFCNEPGHIASKCPKNQNGIYYKGGECFNCGSKDHLAKNCTVKSGK
jgi:zinc finger CCHC domain-containing protein 9